MADVKAAKLIVNFGDQPILVALDIENRPLGDRIRTRKGSSDVRQILPHCLLRNAKPSVKRAFELNGRSAACLSFLRLMTCMPLLGKFALCEGYTSQIANLSIASIGCAYP
jgi:hypothetical protein